MAGKRWAHRPPDGYDTAWKGILEVYLRAFVALLMPLVYVQIDWQQGWVFCDGELLGVVEYGAKGLKRVDRLVKVRLLNGQERYLYIHIEIQSQRDPDFPRRMWVYFVMLNVKFDGRVSSIAVLGDSDAHWRPDSYSFDQWGNSGTFRYPVVKLLDWADRYEELMASDSVIAVAIAAHLKAVATRRNMGSRKEQKSAILKTLLEQGRSSNEIRDLFRFLDLVMALPQDLQDEFKQNVQQMEKEKGMPFLSYIEQDAMKQGQQQGRQEGRQSDIVDALEVRFREVPVEVRSAVVAVKDVRRLRALHRQAILCRSMDEFERSLKGRNKVAGSAATV